jgi:hypothetical protein
VRLSSLICSLKLKYDLIFQNLNFGLNRTHACENHTRACENHTLRAETTLVRVEITLVRVEITLEHVF